MTGPGLADRLLRLVGALLAVLAGFGTGALAVLLVPLRLVDLGWPASSGAAATRLPLALVVATGGTLFLVWFARRATGWRWAGLLPAAGWFTVVVLAVRTSTGGDRLLMPDDWVAALSLFAGTVVMVVGLVIDLTGRRPVGPSPGGLPSGGPLPSGPPSGAPGTARPGRRTPPGPPSASRTGPPGS